MCEKNSALDNPRKVPQIDVGPGRTRTAIKTRFLRSPVPAEAPAVTVDAELGFVRLPGLAAKRVWIIVDELLYRPRFSCISQPATHPVISSA